MYAPNRFRLQWWPLRQSDPAEVAPKPRPPHRSPQQDKDILEGSHRTPSAKLRQETREPIAGGFVPGCSQPLFSGRPAEPIQEPERIGVLQEAIPRRRGCVRDCDGKSLLRFGWLQ